MFHIWTTHDHILFQIARIQLEKTREQVEPDPDSDVPRVPEMIQEALKTGAILRRRRKQETATTPQGETFAVYRVTALTT